MGKYFLFISSMVSAIQPIPFTAILTDSGAIYNPSPVSADIASEIATTTRAWVTAYSSTPEETDDTPFITAANTNVRDGIVATNMFPFGTRIKIPKLFGDEIFVVEDKMHRRKKNFIDIWMPSKEQAKEFGIIFTEIIVLNQREEI